MLNSFFNVIRKIDLRLEIVVNLDKVITRMANQWIVSQAALRYYMNSIYEALLNEGAFTLVDNWINYIDEVSQGLKFLQLSFDTKLCLDQETLTQIYDLENLITLFMNGSIRKLDYSRLKLQLSKGTLTKSVGDQGLFQLKFYDVPSPLIITECPLTSLTVTEKKVLLVVYELSKNLDFQLAPKHVKLLAIYAVIIKKRYFPLSIARIDSTPEIVFGTDRFVDRKLMTRPVTLVTIDEVAKGLTNCNVSLTNKIVVNLCGQVDITSLISYMKCIKFTLIPLIFIRKGWENSKYWARVEILRKCIEAAKTASQAPPQKQLANRLKNLKQNQPAADHPQEASAVQISSSGIDQRQELQQQQQQQQQAIPVDEEEQQQLQLQQAIPVDEEQQLQQQAISVDAEEQQQQQEQEQQQAIPINEGQLQQQEIPIDEEQQEQQQIPNDNKRKRTKSTDIEYKALIGVLCKEGNRKKNHKIATR